MKRRSSKAVQLILITSVLASCNKPEAKQEVAKQQVYMRADSTAQYTNVTNQYQQNNNSSGGMGSALLWYMAFRHLGGGMGYASNGLNPNSVVGTNKAKANAYGSASKRSGFGSTATKTTTTKSGYSAGS